MRIIKTRFWVGVILGLCALACGDVMAQQTINSIRTPLLSGLDLNSKLQNSFLETQSENEMQSEPAHDAQESFGMKKVLDNEHTQSNLQRIHHLNGLSRMMNDTLIVGYLPGDTVRVSGVWSNNGPIIVLQDGVLIFDHANATILGDLYVIGHGQVWADSSTLFFPQQYFYQRSILAVDTSVLNIQNSTLDFGGMSHNLVAYGNAEITFNNIHHADWTTAGIYDHVNFFCDGNNLGGEYICTGNSNINFRNTNTLLVWHHLPDTAVIQHQFPSGANVASYTFNNQQSGIQGVGYSVQLDTCTDVMWAIMPENGSDVSISNSTIRAIGLWFNRGDSVGISGLVNNSNYSNFTAPLADRNLQLQNSQLQTWSVYLFDSSEASISGCILGEVGAMGRSQITANGFYCDGSGGYFWASENGVVFASNVSVGTSVRSEKNGIMVFGYGSVNSGGAVSIAQSLLVVVQSSLPADPVANDGSTTWYMQVDAPAATYADSVVHIPGSVWIDQGPQGSFMNFTKYGVYYQIPNAPDWTPIDTGIYNEVRHGTLANWNTHGLAAGSYYIRLLSFNDLGDSIEAIRQVTLLPLILGIDESITDENISIYPNPSRREFQINLNLEKPETFSFRLIDLSGRFMGDDLQMELQQGLQNISFNTSDLSPGFYFLQIKTLKQTIVKRVQILN